MLRQFMIFYGRPALLLGLLLAGASARAQAPGNGGTTGGPPAPTAPAAVPLDGGAALFAASGIAYGLRYLRQRRKAA